MSKVKIVKVEAYFLNDFGLKEETGTFTFNKSKQPSWEVNEIKVKAHEIMKPSLSEAERKSKKIIIAVFTTKGEYLFK